MEIFLSLNHSKFGKFILFMYLLLLLLIFLNKKISFKINKNSKLYKIINKKYILKHYVNINEIESLFPRRRKWTKNKKNVINIGIQLDPNYILRVMMTLASIIDSQNPETKLRFHFAVVQHFDIEHMLKIYSLRDRIRDDIEFIFYNAKKSEIDLRNLNPKGPGAVAKLLLPNLLPNDVERLIVFDTGDLLVLRDLTIMYNWKMDNYICLGIPGGKIGKYALISKKKYVRYINTGSILINVLPFKFGMRSPYGKDADSDIILKDNPYSYYAYVYSKVNSSFNPKSYNKFMQLGYNPIVIHQFNGKWMHGKGLTIYRRIAQYYIRMAGIWNEMCKEFPGYCKK